MWGLLPGVLKFQEIGGKERSKKAKTESNENWIEKQNYLVLVVLCGNCCVLFYDTAFWKQHTSSVRNQCNMSLNCYILVRSIVLCYIGHKWSVSVNSRTLILVIQCYMFWFNEPSFVEPKHVALDGNIIVLCVTVIIILYLIWTWCIVRVLLIGEDRSTQTENCLTITVPLYRLSLCHFTYC